MHKNTIGPCTLYCGDCMDILPELPKVSVCIADPPYSSGGLMRSDRNAGSSSKYVDKEYQPFSGDNRDQRSFTIWTSEWMRRLFNVMAEGSYFYCFIDWRQLPCIVDAIQTAGFIYRGIMPWDKTQAVRPQKGLHRNQCEYIVWGTRGAPRNGNIRPGFFYHPIEQNKIHPTQKPAALMRELIALETRGIVLDPFMGSGSAAVACAEKGRPFIGIEMDAFWYGKACQRIEQALAGRSLLDSMNVEMEYPGLMEAD